MSNKIMARPAMSMVRAPVAAGDSIQEFQQLMAVVSKSYEPCNSYELFLVTQMTSIHWRILRLEAHDTAKISTGRVLLAAGIKPQMDRARNPRSTMVMPRGIGMEEMNSIKLEANLYRLLGKLREEFQASRTRSGAAAASLNQNLGYTVSELIVPQLPEKNELPDFEETLAKAARSAE